MLDCVFHVGLLLEQACVIVKEDSNVVVELLLGHLVLFEHFRYVLEELVCDLKLVLQETVPRSQFFHCAALLDLEVSHCNITALLIQNWHRWFVSNRLGSL